MSDCCCPPAPVTERRPGCVTCSTGGTLVDLHTIKALLTAPALSRLNASTFYFCSDPLCPTVYFGVDGQRFATSDVRVPIWQKEPVGSRVVCYCFGENERDIQREVMRDGSSRAVTRVREHIAARRCACEVRNPRGSCCLGDVTAAVARAQSMEKVS